MALRLSMVTQMAPVYASLVSGWQGHLAAVTVHGRRFVIGPGDDADLSEIGLFIGWRGAQPGGVFIPFSELELIEQVSEDAAARLRDVE